MNKFIAVCLLPIWYKLCCLGRVKKQILFIVIRGEKLPSDFAMIKKHVKKDEELKVYKREYHYLTLGKGTKIKYAIRCFSLMPKLARSKYVFVSDGINIIANLRLRKGTKMVQTWHGCGGLKKFGNDLDDSKKLFGNEDIVAVSSSSMVPVYSKAMGLDVDVIKSIGVAHTDIYFSKSFKKNCQKLRDELLGGRNKKIVLYAPTYRGDINAPRDASGLNLDLMYKHLNQEYIVISRIHPLLKPVKKNYRHKDFYYDVSSVWSIEEALMVCDILITDYSSIVFDYSLLNKPVLFYAFDLDEYQSNTGFYIDYKSEIPGTICTSTMDVVKEIKNGSYDVTAMKRFRDKYMDKCDGHATKRIIDMVFGDEL